MDLNADKCGTTRPKAKQLKKRVFHVSSQPVGSLFAKTKAAKVELIVEVHEVEEFVEPELLEVLNEKHFVDEDKVEAVLAIDVKAKEEMQEVVSIVNVTPK